jgi:hypothetical protein
MVMTEDDKHMLMPLHCSSELLLIMKEERQTYFISEGDDRG